MNLVHTTLRTENISLHSYQCLLGKMAFAAQVVPRARLQMHNLILYLRHIHILGSNSTVQPATKLHQILRWWTVASNLQVVTPFRSRGPDLFLWTNASLTGFGAINHKNQSIQGLWTQAQQGLHINAKELLSVLLALKLHIVPHQASIILDVDNQVAIFCLKNWGSNRSPILQEITEQIMDIVERKNLTLSPTFIPRHLNASADSLSRTHPVHTEWCLLPETFQKITKWHGPLEVDLMATPQNSQLAQSICPYTHPLAVGVDFFMTPLTCLTQVYIFPPISLILRVLNHLKSYQGQGVIIAPW